MVVRDGSAGTGGAERHSRHLKLEDHYDLFTDLIEVPIDPL
jgi:hypothetical protein